jgi:hypothetical protein
MPSCCCGTSRSTVFSIVPEHWRADVALALLLIVQRDHLAVIACLLLGYKRVAATLRIGGAGGFSRCR